MPKKRKTRKQKEQSKSKIPVFHNDIDTSPKYKVEKTQIKVVKQATVKTTDSKLTMEDLALNKDLLSISTASGIIVAFYILLAVLLFSGTVRLNFLGY